MAAKVARLLRPGGALGATAWVSTPNEPNRLWQETAESFAGKGTLARAVAQALPCEERFSEPASLKVALEEAGVVRVFVEQRAYPPCSPAPRSRRTRRA